MASALLVASALMLNLSRKRMASRITEKLPCSIVMQNQLINTLILINVFLNEVEYE
ncbi:hypothetical protein [Shewanella sp. UCD-FRSSP16_17]|uniref:hypothetical protein n=1 Tax=Shewanella sp. UCD-FRSSP16_17 TaxID=1853256 RepID=UPI0012E8FBEC|nr:hypothetical protein [Shewanella sp. UCD-FRSSP16_17]